MDMVKKHQLRKCIFLTADEFQLALDMAYSDISLDENGNVIYSNISPDLILENHNFYVVDMLHSNNEIIGYEKYLSNFYDCEVTSIHMDEDYNFFICYNSSNKDGDLFYGVKINANKNIIKSITERLERHNCTYGVDGNVIYVLEDDITCMESILKCKKVEYEYIKWIP